jgi:hypothetical protein
MDVLWFKLKAYMNLIYDAKKILFNQKLSWSWIQNIPLVKSHHCRLVPIEFFTKTGVPEVGPSRESPTIETAP